MNEIVIAGSHPVMPKASQSNSIFRKYADVLTGGRTTDAIRYAEREVGMDHVSAFFDAFSRTSGGIATGGLFGFLAKHDMIDFDGKPVDLGASAISNAIGVFMARSAVGAGARNFASHAACVWSFRKVAEWKAGAAKTATIAGEDDDDDDHGFGEDPIVAAARDL
jgi:hypothetical protein